MVAYMIVGPRNVDGTPPGGTVDVADPVRARRLVRSGHLQPAADDCAAPTAAGEPCTKKAGDGGFCHLHQPDLEGDI